MIPFIRKARESDTEFFLEIQSYPNVARFDTDDKVKLADWFKNNLDSHFVIDMGGKPAGIFRVEDMTAISIAVKPEFRRKKLGSYAVSHASEVLKRKLVAFIDNSNEQSKDFFKSLGFKKEQFDCYSSN